MHTAGEGVEDAGHLSVIHAVSVANLFGNASNGEDGYCIVGGAHIHHADECRYRQFGATLALDVARHLANQEVDTAIGTNNLQQSASHHGDNDQFTHVHDTRSHTSKPSIQVVGAVDHADNTSQQDADNQDCHHVHAENGTDEDDKIGDYLDVIHGRDVCG